MDFEKMEKPGTWYSFQLPSSEAENGKQNALNEGQCRRHGCKCEISTPYASHFDDLRDRNVKTNLFFFYDV
jgi:hypothetical protein